MLNITLNYSELYNKVTSNALGKFYLGWNNNGEPSVVFVEEGSGKTWSNEEFENFSLLPSVWYGDAELRSDFCQLHREYTDNELDVGDFIDVHENEFNDWLEESAGFEIDEWVYVMREYYDVDIILDKDN
jgi:hypothetical protein